MAEGESVLLLVRGLSETLRVFYWYKGDAVLGEKEIMHHVVASNSTVHGPAYSHRETAYSNGSLLLRNATQGDEGAYLIHMIEHNFTANQASVRFQVHRKCPPWALLLHRVWGQQ